MHYPYRYFAKLQDPESSLEHDVGEVSFETGDTDAEARSPGTPSRAHIKSTNSESWLVLVASGPVPCNSARLQSCKHTDTRTETNT